MRWIAADASNQVTRSKPSDSDCVAISMWDGIRVASDLAWPIPSPFSLGVFWREVKRADVIHLHEPFYPACQIAYWFAIIQRKPVVITQHIADMPVAGRLRKQAVALANFFFTRPAHAGAAKVVFYSARSRAFFESSCRRKDILIHNGCDTEVFQYGGEDDAVAARRQLQISHGIPVVLFVGRFIEKKGVRILKKIAEKNPSIHFLFVGLGPLNPALWNLPNVTVVPPRAHNKLAVYYRSADLLLLPAVGEGFPLVVQEAMCSGLPCLVSNEIAEACPDLAEDFLLAGSGGKDTDEALTMYLMNPMDWEDRKKISERARKLWSWEHCGSQYLDIFRSIHINEN